MNLYRRKIDYLNILSEKVLTSQPLLDGYNDVLRNEKKVIDFNDMLNNATDFVNTDEFKEKLQKYKYKYVIIDEYQDITKGQLLLLKALREFHDYDLFCVGDDWQSIYRFNGSDIGFIKNFEKYWGVYEKNRIEKTYRFSNDLAKISSKFIMSNRAQETKNIKGRTDKICFPIEEISAYFINDFALVLEKILSALPEYNDNKEPTSVFLLGRYKRDEEIITDSKYSTNFEDYKDSETGISMLRYKPRDNLKIRFLTIHKSKGLQADYVFILNNKYCYPGFPSQIAETPILSLLLEFNDNYPYAEERRLFYVALTRAKEKVYLLTQIGNESNFINEILPKKREKIDCPWCNGRLLYKKGPSGDLLGCSNYKHYKKGCCYMESI